MIALWALLAPGSSADSCRPRHVLRRSDASGEARFPRRPLPGGWVGFAGPYRVVLALFRARFKSRSGSVGALGPSTAGRGRRIEPARLEEGGDGHGGWLPAHPPPG